MTIRIFFNFPWNGLGQLIENTLGSMPYKTGQGIIRILFTYTLIMVGHRMHSVIIMHILYQ